MTSLFFLGCFCHLVVSQTLYEPTLVENTLLNNGVQTKSDTLLKTCEKSLQNEHTASIELARNVLNLTSYLETTTIALMALQQKFNVTDDMVLDICKIHPELVLPHPFKCQQYYNCSMLEDRDLIDGFCYPVLHLTECIYPYLFSIDTLQCENFTDVKCGSRHEEKYYCSYERIDIRCHSRRPGPTCGDFVPHCIGDPDGFLEDDKKKGSPCYKICFKERVISRGCCPKNDTWGTYMFPYNGKCVPSYEMPASENSNGLLPSCIGKADGSYQFHDRPCDAYFTCKNGTARGIKCHQGELFDVNTGTCVRDAHCTGLV